MKNLLFVVLSVLITWQIGVINNVVSPVNHIIILKEDPIKATLTSLGCPNEKLKEITNAIRLAEQQTKLNPYLLCVLMSTESNFNYKAVSPKGYKGLMQTPTATKQWADVDVLHGARILQEKLIYAKGDIFKALYLYKGGDNAEAKKQAKQVLTLYRKVQG